MKFFGYVKWSIEADEPYVGTRRFKVWTTRSGAQGGWSEDDMLQAGCEIREVFVAGSVEEQEASKYANRTDREVCND